MHSNRNTAFSLVELSIVLVILGLLTGGILAGKSLIRATELRSVGVDATKYQTAIAAFRDKYFSVPGDMTNATSFWGTRAGTGSDATCYTTIATYTGTCNGDGNGKITNTTLFADPTGAEYFLAVQHMAYAGLIEGSYTGSSTVTTSGKFSAGTNIPVGKISGSGMRPLSWANVSGNPTQYFPTTPMVNMFTEFLPAGGRLLLPEELWNLDVKLDDGKPASGKVWTLLSSATWGPGCSTTDVASTADYAISSSAYTCDFNMAIY